MRAIAEILLLTDELRELIAMVPALRVSLWRLPLKNRDVHFLFRAWLLIKMITGLPRFAFT